MGKDADLVIVNDENLEINIVMKNIIDICIGAPVFFFIGLLNVKAVVDKYGGDMVLSCDENEFKAVVIL